jgi:hypothetical protein
VIESVKMVTIDADLAEPTGLVRGEEWLSVQGCGRPAVRRLRCAAGSTTSTGRSPQSANYCNVTHRADLLVDR